ALCQAMCRANLIMLSFNLPCVIDVAPKSSFFGGVNPLSTKQPLPHLVLFQLIGRQPPEFLTPHFASLSPLRNLGRNPAAIKKLVTENPPCFFVVWIFPMCLASKLNGQCRLLGFCSS